MQNGFGLFGARESCGQGLCGCCTVFVDGSPVSGCLYLAAFADGASDEQTRDYLSGNLCRCAAYPEIVEAVKAAARRGRWRLSAIPLLKAT